MNNAQRGFREALRARLQAKLEDERKHILTSQKKLIEQYATVTEQLRQSELKISRLVGPPPQDDICPECYYRCGTTVTILPAAGVDRTGSGIMICPHCSLVFTS